MIMRLVARITTVRSALQQLRAQLSKNSKYASAPRPARRDLDALLN